MWYVIENDELYHHGIKGQKWGVRRFQNPDGTLTSAGKKRYMEASPNDSSVTKRVKADWNNLSDSEFRKKYQTTKKVYEKRVKKYGDPYMNSPLAKAGKKLSGIDKQEKKAGKKFETPEEVEKADSNGARKALAISTVAFAALGTVAVAALANSSVTKYGRDIDKIATDLSDFQDQYRYAQFNLNRELRNAHSISSSKTPITAQHMAASRAYTNFNIAKQRAEASAYDRIKKTKLGSKLSDSDIENLLNDAASGKSFDESIISVKLGEKGKRMVNALTKGA